jgi:hypothetical protein
MDKKLRLLVYGVIEKLRGICGRIRFVLVK